MTSFDRRRFVTTIGAATLAAAAGCRPALAVQPGRRKLRRIGIQLYTLRGEMGRDLPGTLERVAKIGYKEVEFAGYFNRPATEIRALLDKNGLTAPSTHLALTPIEREPQKTFDEAKAIGIEWLTVPSAPGRPTTVDDWKRIADQFNRAAASAKAAGLRFAYHNHNSEFRRLGDTVPFDILLANTDPSLVFFEMDLHWAVVGGADPIAYLDRFPGRVRMFHVKDSMGPPDHKMADVGAGMIDFRKIFAKDPTIEHYFVEHDQPGDAFASAAASFQYLEKLEF